MVSPYRFFSIYRGVQLHFTSSYDLFKYAGKSKSITKEAFDNRKDRQRFVYWSEKIGSAEECLKFCVFNFIKDSNWFYGTFESANENYNKKLGYYSSFKNNLKGDSEYITKLRREKEILFDDMLIETPNGNKPPLLQLYLNNIISVEFLCLLDKTYIFVDGWKEKYSNDPLITSELFKVSKYCQFVVIFNKRK